MPWARKSDKEVICVAVFKELNIGNETDLKKIMKTFYRFGEELRFTFRNLDEGNLSKSYLDHMEERAELTRSIKFDAEELQIRFENTADETYSSLEVSAGNVELLVARGKVVETMLSRIELYGEHINLETGRITVDAENFTLDMAGNATFAGAITGGTMTLGEGFAVDATGHAVIEGNLQCNLLNPKKGVVAGGDVEIESSEDYGYCTVGGTLSGEDAFVYGSLSCSKVKYTSDKRAKRDIHKLDCDLVSALLGNIVPVEFDYKRSGMHAMGFVAQEVLRAQIISNADLPLIKRTNSYLKIPYDSYGAVYAAAIQKNQERIDRILEELEKGGKRVRIYSAGDLKQRRYEKTEELHPYAE